MLVSHHNVNRTIYFIIKKTLNFKIAQKISSSTCQGSENQSKRGANRSREAPHLANFLGKKQIFYRNFRKFRIQKGWVLCGEAISFSTQVHILRLTDLRLCLERILHDYTINTANNNQEPSDIIQTIHSAKILVEMLRFWLVETNNLETSKLDNCCTVSSSHGSGATDRGRWPSDFMVFRKRCLG